MIWTSNRRRATLLAMLVFFLILPATARCQGKGHGVAVKAASATLTESDPGRIVSGSFLVTNTSNAPQEFIESIKLPEGWQAVIPAASFVLSPDQSQVRLVAFQTPSSAPAGRYEITYSVRSQKDYGIQDFDTMIVVVLPTHKLAMLLEEKPDVVIAGEAFQLKLRLMNQGNREIHARLSATSNAAYPLKLLPPDLDLPAGGSFVVLIQVQTTDKLLKGFTHYTQLQAIAPDEAGGQSTAGLTVATQIVPTGTKIDTYNRLPSWVTISGTGDGGLQGQFWGEGKLDETGRRKIDFLFRAPDTQSSSFFGQRDEYRLSYFTPDVDLLLGDQTYGLSRLTEYYRYGRGLEIRGRYADIDAGAFFLNSRWQTPTEQEAGIYMGKSWFDQKASIKLNYLTKDNSAPFLNSSNLWSVEARATPVPNTNLQMEYSSCASDRNTGQDDAAYRGQLDGHYGGLNYNLSKIHAGPDFFGYYNNADYLDASVDYPIAARLRGYASTHIWSVNLDSNPAEGSAPRDNYAQGGLSYALSPKDKFTLDYNHLRHEDVLTLLAPSFDETALRIGYGRARGKSNLQLYAAPGWHHDRITGADSAANTYSAFYTVTPSPRQYYTLFAQLGDPRPANSILLGGANIAGISGVWKPTQKLSLFLYYTVQNLGVRNRVCNDQVYFSCVYGTPSQHTWTLVLRRSTPAFGQGETAAYLAYTIPVGIPISKKTRIGIIKGRLFDSDSTGNPGISRAIIKANDAATATDANGEFVFSGLEPGAYLLSVDRKSMGLDRVTVNKTPVVLAVTVDAPMDVQVPVARAAQISGKVATFGYQANAADGGNLPNSALVAGARTDLSPAAAGAGPGSAVEVGGLGNVLVEITDGTDTLRTLTDSKGLFSFEGLRPGNWTAKVYDTNIPALHKLESAEQSLKLSSGEKRESLFKVLPIVRPVKVIDQGTIKSE